MAQLELLFLGTGTSAGIPMIGCHCPVCRSADPRDKRTRPCAMVSYDGQSVLIDCSPEIRLQCLANGVEKVDAIVFTHAHADHIMGLDDARRFNTIRNGPLDVWADRPSFEVLQQCFGYAFRAPDPTEQVYRPHLVHRAIDGPFEIADRRWTPIPLMHGRATILGFRIGKLAYCTDVSLIPEESFGLLHDLDVLVIDGLQKHKHPTHFTIDEAISASRRVGARRTCLTHMAHSISHAQVSCELPAGVELAYDTLRVAASL